MFSGQKIFDTSPDGGRQQDQHGDKTQNGKTQISPLARTLLLGGDHSIAYGTPGLLGEHQICVAILQSNQARYIRRVPI